MKTLSKLHQEAIIKAKTDADKNKAAAMAMIETPIEMIKAIMLKHEMAVIEVMRELHESREAAVRAENEACAKMFDEMADQMVADMEPSTAVAWVRSKAAEIRARRNT
jgi:putative heme iron utilization protein